MRLWSAPLCGCRPRDRATRTRRRLVQQVLQCNCYRLVYLETCSLRSFPIFLRSRGVAGTGPPHRDSEGLGKLKPGVNSADAGDSDLGKITASTSWAGSAINGQDPLCDVIGVVLAGSVLGGPNRVRPITDSCARIRSRRRISVLPRLGGGGRL